MKKTRLALLAVASTVAVCGACGDDRPPGPPDMDAGADTGTRGNDNGPGCPPCALTCELAPPGPDGCPPCRCAAPTPECSVDDDCVVAFHIGVCCPACDGAFPRSVAESETCIVERFRPAPTRSSCTPGGCEDVLCPPVDCAITTDAVCEGGRCVEGFSCAEDEVVQLDTCVPKCTRNEDCVAARVDTGCCPSCDRAIHRTLADREECIVEEGRIRPPGCGPETCPPGPCPDVECTPVVPTCDAEGRCVAGP